MNKFIIQYKPFIDQKEANYLKKVISKTFLTENAETKKFENNFSKKFRMKNVITISNWTVGLFAVLKSINIKEGDEVIIPNLTFFATATPIILSGAKIVLCDVENDNFSLDLKKLEKIITKKTKCIIPVHLFGFCCEMDKLKSICNKRGIYLVEDSAQALGAKYKNKFLGNLGDFGGFSFYGNKIITTGEGSIIVSKKKRFIKKIYSLKNHGRRKKKIFKHKELGYNFMFTEMQAAIGNVQLKKFNSILKKKRKIYNFFYKNLNNLDQINFPQPINFNKPNYWMTCIFVNKDKNKLKAFLKKKKIEIRDNFFPINLQPALKLSKYVKRNSDNFENSINLYKKSIILPSSHDLKLSEMKYICNHIKNFYRIK